MCTALGFYRSLGMYLKKRYTLHTAQPCTKVWAIARHEASLRTHESRRPSSCDLKLCGSHLHLSTVSANFILLAKAKIPVYNSSRIHTSYLFQGSNELPKVITVKKILQCISVYVCISNQTECFACSKGKLFLLGFLVKGWLDLGLH